MTVSEIASLIAAIAFAVLVLFCAIPLFKLGRLFDSVSKSVVELSTEAQQTVVQATQTVKDANAQLERVDAITTSAAQVTQDISAMSTLMSATVGGPLIKVAAFNHAVRSVLGGSKRKED